MSAVTVRFPPELVATVRRLAAAEGITVSEFIRRAVDRGVAMPAAYGPVWPAPTSGTYGNTAAVTVMSNIPLSWTG